MSLSGQRIVVVGGTSGMGLATVRAAAALGAEVIVAGRRPVTERPSLDPGSAGPVDQQVVDVTDEASVQALFAHVGPFDHLLVTATAGTPGPFLAQDVTAARSFMDGKFFTSWACARYAAPLLPPGGSITFVTGAAVERPPRHGSMITAAFAALEALTRALAIELGPVRVNALRPGYTDSEMWSHLDTAAHDDLRARVAAAMPTGRMGTPDDVASAALFLMSNPQVTGDVLEITGGETLVNTMEAQR